MMRYRKPFIIGSILLILIVYLNIIAADVPAGFYGTFQSELMCTEVVGISLFHGENTYEEGTFEEHISCRLVNEGTYKKIEEGKYHFDGDRKEFDIVLNKKEMSFEVSIPKLNIGEPITLKKVGNIPVSYDVKYDDLEKYKEYLEK